MITKQTTMFYYVGDEAFPSLAEAQKCDLKKLIPEGFMAANPMTKDTIAEWLLENSIAIVDTLTTTPRSRARARKANGAKRKRKSNTTTTPTAAPEAPVA